MHGWVSVDPCRQVYVCCTSGLSARVLVERISGGESVGAVLQGRFWPLLFSQGSASETQNRWQKEGGQWGGLNGWLVFVLLFCVCVYPWGASIGYGFHIVHDISHVAAWCGAFTCSALAGYCIMGLTCKIWQWVIPCWCQSWPPCATESFTPVLFISGTCRLKHITLGGV